MVGGRQVAGATADTVEGRPRPAVLWDVYVPGEPGGAEVGRVTIVEANATPAVRAARRLVREYAESLPIDLEFQGFAQELRTFPKGYIAPEGALLLALTPRGIAAGVVALRRLGPTTCEMKRLYVRPRYRGQGYGRALSVAVVRRARSMGYRRMRLDTLATMRPALALYRELGFREIGPYRFNPEPGAHFLELDLGRSARSGRPSSPRRGSSPAPRPRVRRGSAVRTRRRPSSGRTSARPG